MDTPTIVELAEVSGKPRARMNLPSPLRIGDHIQLRFRLTRQNGGRTEVLDVNGDFQVRTVNFDASSGRARQSLSVTAAETSPSWQAIKKTSSLARKMGPAKHPPVNIE